MLSRCVAEHFFRVDRFTVLLDVGRKDDAIAAIVPPNRQQRATEVLIDAQDLQHFARLMNFAGTRIPHKFAQSCGRLCRRVSPIEHDY